MIKTQQPMFSNAIWRSLVVVFAFLVTFTASGVKVLQGQTKYSPDHPEVKELAQRALGALGGGNEGELILSALATVQYYKRYEGRIPRDNANINSGVEAALEMISSGAIDRQNECYQPALVVILLCEVDSVRYKDEIIRALDMFSERQRPSGAFTYLQEATSADTSQTQFVALAIWVAKAKGFEIDLDMASDTLKWFCTIHRGTGQWRYKYVQGQSNRPSTLAMQAAGLSSTYLMADCLQLNSRSKNMAKAGADEVGLPRTVSIYVPSVDGKSSQKKDGPLVGFDRGLLNSTMSLGSQALEARFQYGAPAWNYYYMYAIERYAYFREQAEGSMGRGKFENWYDEGIEYFKSKHGADGSYTGIQLETKRRASAFAILFMVRSSELINLPPAESVLRGGNKFDTGVTIRDRNGSIDAVRPEQNLQDMLQMLEDNKKASQEELQRISEALKKQVVAFRNENNKSRGKIKSFLRSMVGANNYYRRLIAVRFLAAEQDMDNVPALILGLSDPDFRVAIEAHDGLRLISRKVNSLSLSDETIKNSRRDPDVLKKEPDLVNRMRREFAGVEVKWTDWFLKIRPDAELLGANPLSK